ncbi:NnrS family protein [Brevundimonas aveniformis]|uniref:NnrS family protein n=1 Tax=Brevundimonas aveniformis TaxID=370977 RepID=UPI0004919330|nr:NnrS family protein [Brevundimonas aveniformis]
MNTASAMRAHRGPALFSIGLRPFFLFSAIWAALAVPLWVHAYAAGGPIGLTWHIHEMLFGYAAGVIVGFLMTAVPNWTGRMPVVGLPLMGMVGLWLAGRAAMLMTAFSQAAATAVWPAIVDSLLLVVMAGLVWREILTGQNWRNLPVAIMVTLLAASNIGFHVEAHLMGGAAPTATRATLALIAMLIALIGGRITPSFTRNWQLKRSGPLPATTGPFDGFVLAMTGLSLVGWVVAPQQVWVGVGLITAGGLNLVRLARWKGWATVAEPLVMILHLGYLWLSLALGLIGASIVWPMAVGASAGVHALTAGAIGVMTLAVMTRAGRGHTGRPLTAGATGVLIYALINAAALVRVIGGLWLEAYQPLLVTSAVLWCLAFLTFAVVYGPMLIGPRPQAQA